MEAKIKLVSETLEYDVSIGGILLPGELVVEGDIVFYKTADYRETLGSSELRALADKIDEIEKGIAESRRYD